MYSKTSFRRLDMVVLLSKSCCFSSPKSSKVRKQTKKSVLGVLYYWRALNWSQKSDGGGGKIIFEFISIIVRTTTVVATYYSRVAGSPNIHIAARRCAGKQSLLIRYIQGFWLMVSMRNRAY